MITLRRSAERGHADLGWIDSYYTFSFAGYHDPAHMGFRALRVINDDRIAAGRGFGAHAHRDMEIITYVLEGSIAHRDSTGESGCIGPGTVQVMSAGTGVIHSEFNGSNTEPGHFLQIWIEPAFEDAEPSYQQVDNPPAERSGRLRLLAGPKEHSNGGAAINQNALVYASELAPSETLSTTLAPGRHAWIHVARGSVSINGTELAEGDGAALSEECELKFSAGSQGAEFLFFDLS